jgi:hypothetical protein
MLAKSIVGISCLLVLSVLTELPMPIDGDRNSRSSSFEKTTKSTSLLARVVHDSGDGSPPPPPPSQEGQS